MNFKVEKLSVFFEQAVNAYGYWGMALLALVVATFIIQLCYYLGRYSSLPKYKNNRKQPKQTAPEPVSIILTMGEDYLWLEHTLPIMLTQDYFQYEIVVVYVGNNTEFAETLQQLSISASSDKCRLTYTQIKQHSIFPITLKMALNVGIKAASYEHLIITTPDMRPTSGKRWLPVMAGGFSRGEIVLGYCGMAKDKGLSNKLIRMSRMMRATRALSSAVRGVTYKSSIQNLGLSKKLYFDNKGFGFLNMNIGEDDLFVQQIATSDNVSIIMHPNATVRQKCWGGMNWWYKLLCNDSRTFRYYPSSVQNYIYWEPLSRAVFFMATIAALVVMPNEIRIGVLTVLMIRYFLVLWQMLKVAHRLGEDKLMGSYFVYDLALPIVDLLVLLSRRPKSRVRWN